MLAQGPSDLGRRRPEGQSDLHRPPPTIHLLASAPSSYSILSRLMPKVKTSAVESSKEVGSKGEKEGGGDVGPSKPSIPEVSSLISLSPFTRKTIRH